MDSRLLTLSIVIASIAICNGQGCKKLENGKYSLKPEGFEEFELIIQDNSVVKIKKNRKQDKGKIEWTSNCSFVISSEDSTLRSDTTSFINKTHRGWGRPCYELIGNRKYRTTWTGNIHVTTSEGRIKRIKH